MKRKEKIKKLEQDILDFKKENKFLKLDRDDWRKLFIKLKREKTKKYKKKICSYCGNPIDKKPESKKEKNKRIMDGINELKKRGIFV